VSGMVIRRFPDRHSRTDIPGPMIQDFYVY
jgi:hypothetical protein